MLVVMETTVWTAPAADHIYMLDDSRTKMFGYVPFGDGEPTWFPSPRSFDPKGRKFVVLEKQPDPAVDEDIESWNIPGSNGSVWKVTREDDVFVCSCPQNKFKRAECKHIKQVKEMLTVK